MPRETRGQQISFGIESDPDKAFDHWVWVAVRKHETIRHLANRVSHPELARQIADRNGIRSLTARLKRKQVLVPGVAAPGNGFHVLAGDEPPSITAGYAKFQIVNRPGRTGLVIFDGYDPIGMDVPIRFEGPGRGVQIEDDIALLEWMAGRQAVSAAGEPPVVRVSTTLGDDVIPLIPLGYQFHGKTGGPLWYVAGIAWDAGALRDARGRRIRQTATVHLQQRTTARLLPRSVADRAKGK